MNAEQDVMPVSRRKWRRILIYAVLAGLVVMIVGVLYFPIFKENVRRISCAGNLHSWGLVFSQYAMDFNDYFPDKDGVAGFEILRSEDYCSDYRVYICPSTSMVPPQQGPVISTYEYRGGLKAIPKDAQRPLMWDKCGNHKGYYNVLFCDGHVEGITISNGKAIRREFHKGAIHFSEPIHSELPPEVLRLIETSSDKR